MSSGWRRTSIAIRGVRRSRQPVMATGPMANDETESEMTAGRQERPCFPRAAQVSDARGAGHPSEPTRTCRRLNLGKPRSGLFARPRNGSSGIRADKRPISTKGVFALWSCHFLRTIRASGASTSPPPFRNDGDPQAPGCRRRAGRLEDRGARPSREDCERIVAAARRDGRDCT